MPVAAAEAEDTDRTDTMKVQTDCAFLRHLFYYFILFSNLAQQHLYFNVCKCQHHQNAVTPD